MDCMLLDCRLVTQPSRSGIFCRYLWLTSWRSAPIFASGRRPAPQKPAKRKRSGDPDSLRAGIIQGVMRFIAPYKDEYQYNRLVKRLATVYPMKLVRDADAMSGAVSYRYMMQVLKLYNGTSKKNVLPVKF